jgi:large subunit ribosomal protein L21
MHAIVETGGKQYRVAPGDVIRVEKLAGDVGSEVELPAKATFQDGGELVHSEGVRVKATILGNDRAPKILVFKFKRKKQYKKTIGHRQAYTELKVGEIVA